GALPVERLTYSQGLLHLQQPTHGQARPPVAGAGVALLALVERLGRGAQPHHPAGRTQGVAVGLAQHDPTAGGDDGALPPARVAPSLPPLAGAGPAWWALFVTLSPRQRSSRIVTGDRARLTILRISSSGASWPVKWRNCSAAWRTNSSTPVMRWQLRSRAS